jgi:hypothetical protein
MVKDYDERVRVFVLHYDELYEITEGLEHPWDEYTNIITIQDPGSSDCMIMT